MCLWEFWLKSHVEAVGESLQVEILKSAEIKSKFSQLKVFYMKYFLYLNLRIKGRLFNVCLSLKSKSRTWNKFN